MLDSQSEVVPIPPITTRRKRSGNSSANAPVALAERWSNSTMFVMAAGGATLGFNNLWQFPLLSEQYGGGAFLLAYVLCTLVLGVPLLIAQITIGQRGRGSPIAAFVRLAEAARVSRLWTLVAGLGVLGGFLILSYLSVIAGWALAFMVRSGLGRFTGLTADGIGSVFTALVHDPEKQLFWHGMFLFVTLLVVARGVRAGIEPTVRVLMTLTIGSLIALACYAGTTQSFDAALARVFVLDFTKLTVTGWLAALAHAFFSLSLGLGIMVMYGAYLGRGSSVTRLSVAIVVLDTVTAIVAAVVVYAVLAAGNVDPAAGPNLVFQALPLAFDQLPLGRVFMTVFLVLMVAAALLTAIALAEPVVAWLTERFGLTRGRAAVAVGMVVWALGVVSILSFDHWAFSFHVFGVEKYLGAFDVLQLLTAQALLPLAGLSVAVFAGWVLKPDATGAVVGLRTPGAFTTWLWLVRVAIPLALLVLLANLSTLYA